jgi:hypothetical protein
LNPFEIRGASHGKQSCKPINPTPLTPDQIAARR